MLLDYGFVLQNHAAHHPNKMQYSIVDIDVLGRIIRKKPRAFRNITGKKQYSESGEGQSTALMGLLLDRSILSTFGSNKSRTASSVYISAVLIQYIWTT